VKPTDETRNRSPIWLTRQAATVVVVLLVFFTAATTALAIDQPPQEPEQLRAWLVGHLVTDMEALGTFDTGTLAKVPGIVNALTDDQVALLSQYYFLTRSKTQQDASLYALQQQGRSDEQVNEAKAEIADLLTVMNDQAVACYDRFVPMPQPVQYVAQLVYASVPGWCCHARCFVPEWYYDNGCYVGPCFNAAYAGAWAVPVCNAYYDHGSRFYSTYHNVANAVHASRSINLAKRQADRFRHQGDWRSVMAHDRLLNRAHGGSYALPSRIAANAPTRDLAIRKPRPASVVHAGSKQPRPNVHVGNPTQVTRQQKTNSYPPTLHPTKAQHREAKPHTSHAPATHAPASRPAAHATHPTPAAHASHTRPAPHAQAHASHPEQQKRR
jgi:hypothetical protein